MFHSLLLPGFRRIIWVFFACCLRISGNQLRAQTPAPPSPPRDTAAKTDSTAKSSPSAGPSEEVSSRNTPTTFKVRVNLVLVRVVAPDQQGKIVSTPHKQDFPLYHHRKLPTISSFTVETPQTRTDSALASTA